MSEDAEIKGVIPSYYGFLITGITQLREYWARKMYIEALDYALELTNFLPNKIKKEIAESKALIVKKLAGNIPENANTLYALQRAKDQNAYRIARQELEPFVDKMISLLDSNRLLTQQYGVPTRARSMKDFQMDIDVAKHRAEQGEN
jgi:hypothetical protein